MVAFLSTVKSKIDAKGRVLVPAVFRGVAKAQGFNGVYLYNSLTEQAIEGGGKILLDELLEMVERLPPHSEEKRSLGSVFFADGHQINFDGDGRITLPEMLLSHAEIKGDLTFVGLGRGFQIWEPSRFAAYHEKARQQASRHLATLRPLRGKGEG